MLKKDETTNPQSCLSRSKDDEMIFVLTARDKCAPAAIRFWASQRIITGKNVNSDPQIQEAWHCADEMERQYLALENPNVFSIGGIK